MLALVPLEARREKFTFRACEIRDSGEYINTRKGWCPRTGRGQRLMGIKAVTGYGSV